MKNTLTIDRTEARPCFMQVRELIDKTFDKPGMKLPSLRDLAERFDLSVETVRMALASLAGEGKLESSWGKGYYRKKETAESVEKPSTVIIGAVMPVSVPIFQHARRGMEDVCREKGYGLLVANLPGAPGHQSRILEMFDREGIKNVIIAPDVVHNEVRELVTGNRFKMSFVLMEEDIKGVCADSVTVNHFQGAYDAVSELIKLGRRRIGYIGNGRTDDLRNQERERGCRQAILDNGLPLDENLVMQYPFRSGVTPEPNDPMLRAYFMSDRRPDAVFVFCDANAITVCGFLSGAGVSIPDEVAVMGFDNSPACGSLKVPLSSVEQYPYELGAKAAELMISRIKGGAHRHKVKTVIRPTVILRESTQNKQ